MGISEEMGGHIMMPNGQTYAKSAVRVGAGRGFVVAGSQERRYVITAAHCLPELPPPHLARYLEEYTFRMVGPLGQEPHVMAACVFVDTMADVAVLGAPDNQDYGDEADEYERLTTALPAMALAAPPPIPKAIELTIPPATADLTTWFEEPRLAHERNILSSSNGVPGYFRWTAIGLRALWLTAKTVAR